MVHMEWRGNSAISEIPSAAEDTVILISENALETISRDSYTFSTDWLIVERGCARITDGSIVAAAITGEIPTTMSLAGGRFRMVEDTS